MPRSATLESASRASPLPGVTNHCGALKTPERDRRLGGGSGGSSGADAGQKNAGTNVRRTFSCQSICPPHAPDMMPANTIATSHLYKLAMMAEFASINGFLLFFCF
jgi:hypothetical protein